MMLIYGGWFDWSLLTEWSAESHRWRRIGYAVVVEVVVLIPILWVVVFLANRKLAMQRRAGTLDVLGTVVAVPTVTGEVGEIHRSIVFTLEADDGTRWDVESHPLQHWPKASLAAGWTADRVAPTHPRNLAWRGLRPGERVWLVGAARAPGPADRLLIIRGQGLLIRGGPAAAYTHFGLLVPLTWVFMLWIQPLAWDLAALINRITD